MLHETNFVEYLVISRSKLRPVLDAKGIRSHEIYVEAFRMFFLLEKLCNQMLNLLYVAPFHIFGQIYLLLSIFM